MSSLLHCCCLALAVLAGTAATRAADASVAVRPEVGHGAVSPLLFGFNAIYCNEPDAQWATDKIPAQLKQISTGVVRYPAGTVVTYYHWTNPTGQGWADAWDPAFKPAKNKPESETMSIDEYLDFVKASGTTPLVGVNMSSGKRFNRVTEGIEEAKALVQHCLGRGVRVQYYYLDNEPYIRNANRPMSAAEYAEQINLYAAALRSIDPAIKIIANLHSGVTHTDEVRTAVRLAGRNIDLVDLHFYWRHGTATFENWTKEPHMLHQRGKPYSEQRAIYRKLFAEEGFPAIDLISLEWNVGPPPDANSAPTSAQVAIMAAEEFMQFIKSGMPMACFWPLHWEGGDQRRALLSSAHGYSTNKVYGMFEQFASVPGQMQVATSQSGPASGSLTSLAIQHRDGSIVVYLLNKHDADDTVAIDIDLGNARFGSASAVGFESTDASPGPLAVHPIAAAVKGSRVALTLPRHAFARLTLTNPQR